MLVLGLRGCALISSALFLFATSALAQDDPEKIGLATGFGLTAATGKTTMGDGAGAIEASLLDSDAMLKAGAAIRKIALAEAGNRPVLILGKGDSIDFSMALWVMKRMKDLNQGAGRLKPDRCKKPAAGPIVTFGDSIEKSESKIGFVPSDITAALATDISIGKIELSAEDRTLINAVRIGASGDPGWKDLSSLDFPAATSAPANAGDGQFMTLNEQLAVDPETNAAFRELAQLQGWTDDNRHCDSDRYKAMIDTIDKFIASVSSAEKGPPPIVTTALLAASGFSKLPLILRVGIDDRGGTSITRSNIWYTLGYPGAAVITSGLKISFQIIDPQHGLNLRSGLIRCATRPTSYREVRHMLITQSPKGEDSYGARQAKLVTCAYRLS